MKTKQILFFDIDGTIYREGRGVPDSTRTALQKCAARGHLLMLCTGRGFSSIPDEVLGLPFRGGVFGCGTQVAADDRMLTDAAVMGTHCREIVDTLYETHCPFFVNNSDYIYYTPDFVPDGFSQIVRQMYLAYHGRLRPMEENPGRISKLTAYPRDRARIPEIADRLSPWFDLIEHQEYAYIELVLKGHSKGTGVIRLLQEYGLGRTDSLGFGDSGNDLPMLEAVGRGFVMAEAPAALQERFCSAGPLDDGIARTLGSLGLI